jgi:hypothetical protein
LRGNDQPAQIVFLSEEEEPIVQDVMLIDPKMLAARGLRAVRAIIRSITKALQRAKAADDAPNRILPKAERLEIFKKRLLKAPASKSADEAFELLGKILDGVEDAFSGVAKVSNPGLKYQGRMYPPQADFTTRLADGGLEAITRGNIIRITPDGTTRIYEQLADGTIGKLLLEKLGEG